MEEGSGVTFTVYEEKSGKKVAETGATVKDGKVEAQWTYHYNGEQLTEKPKYYYEAEAFRCRTKRSAAVEIGARIKFIVMTDDLYLFAAKENYLVNGEIKKKIEPEMSVYENEIIPGNWKYCAEDFSISDTIYRGNMNDFSTIQRCSFMDLETGIKIKQNEFFCILLETRYGGSK